MTDTIHIRSLEAALSGLLKVVGEVTGATQRHTYTSLPLIRVGLIKASHEARMALKRGKHGKADNQTQETGK